jgi:hypothetical protein
MGCSTPMLSVNSALKSTTTMVETQDARMDKPAELRERTAQVYQAVLFLVFTGYLDPKKGDLGSLMEVDAVDYFVSVAYAALVEKDYPRYDAAIAEAEAIVSRVEAQLKKLIEKLKQKESI